MKDFWSLDVIGDEIASLMVLGVIWGVMVGQCMLKPDDINPLKPVVPPPQSVWNRRLILNTTACL
jgi:hypothetical protein